jgi:hypothetical protein
MSSQKIDIILPLRVLKLPIRNDLNKTKYNDLQKIIMKFGHQF